jgi:hypothetical protein
MNRVLCSPETTRDLNAISHCEDYAAPDIAGKGLVLLLNSIQSGELSKPETTAEFWRELRWKIWHFVENGSPNAKDIMKATLSQLLKSVRSSMPHSAEPDIEGLVLLDLRSAVVNAISKCLTDSVSVSPTTTTKELNEIWDTAMSEL